MKQSIAIHRAWRWLPVLVGMMFLEAAWAFAQSDFPTSVVYLVRDEKGELLDPSKLDAITSPKNEEMTPAKTFLEKPDGSVTRDVPCLQSRIDVGGGPVKISELTLKLNGKTMRLILNAEAYQERKLIDSLPFQEGTFEWKDEKWAKK